MGEAKGKRHGASTSSFENKAQEAISQDRDGTVWVRDDGAICVGNECIVIKGETGREMELAIDPDKCPCEIEDRIIEALMGSVLSGKGVTVSMKPRTRQRR